MAIRFIDKALSLQNLILGAVVESYIIVKIFVDQLPRDNPLVWVLPWLLAINIGVYCVFWGMIYPYVFSPIRHFPAVKAS
jgi:hypothetical protein